jgi:hypothetical protein
MTLHLLIVIIFTFFNFKFVEASWWGGGSGSSSGTSSESSGGYSNTGNNPGNNNAEGWGSSSGWGGFNESNIGASSPTSFGDTGWASGTSNGEVGGPSAHSDSWGGGSEGGLGGGDDNWGGSVSGGGFSISPGASYTTGIGFPTPNLGPQGFRISTGQSVQRAAQNVYNGFQKSLSGNVHDNFGFNVPGIKEEALAVMYGLPAMMMTNFYVTDEMAAFANHFQRALEIEMSMFSRAITTDELAESLFNAQSKGLAAMAPYASKFNVETNPAAFYAQQAYLQTMFNELENQLLSKGYVIPSLAMPVGPMQLLDSHYANTVPAYQDQMFRDVHRHKGITSTTPPLSLGPKHNIIDQLFKQDQVYVEVPHVHWNSRTPPFLNDDPRAVIGYLNTVTVSYKTEEARKAMVEGWNMALKGEEVFGYAYRGSRLGSSGIEGHMLVPDLDTFTDLNPDLTFIEEAVHVSDALVHASALAKAREAELAGNWHVAEQNYALAKQASLVTWSDNLYDMYRNTPHEFSFQEINSKYFNEIGTKPSEMMYAAIPSEINAKLSAGHGTLAAAIVFDSIKEHRDGYTTRALTWDEAAEIEEAFANSAAMKAYDRASRSIAQDMIDNNNGLPFGFTSQWD